MRFGIPAGGEFGGFQSKLTREAGCHGTRDFHLNFEDIPPFALVVWDQRCEPVVTSLSWAVIRTREPELRMLPSTSAPSRPEGSTLKSVVN